MTRAGRVADNACALADAFPAILALRDKPNILPRHDAEVVGDSVAEKCPLLRDGPPEELEEGCPELAEGRVVAVVGHKVVHQPLASLNGIEVGTVWRDEVQHALAPRLIEPVLHFDGVMIARIVEENVDSPFPCMRGFHCRKQ